ncbi:hypothetical protein COU74_00205 [Candidatus Peregrinibacteria bacterium CG10_big_fil_rev_8_21_14_0_10_36_19]|nr:MAG: hypothetical protein COU74_00205 [Candidatus Peregrinibacteria bacterium CG10_big_fil_rev_8_21_14_0_10_36_19]
MNKLVKIVVYVDVAHADDIRSAMAKAECGKIGNYDSCSFSVRGVGRFRALEGANPFIGEIGKIEEVGEERIETICEESKLANALELIKSAHPYEKPAIDVYPILNIQ